MRNRFKKAASLLTLRLTLNDPNEKGGNMKRCRNPAGRRTDCAANVASDVVPQVSQLSPWFVTYQLLNGHHGPF